MASRTVTVYNLTDDQIKNWKGVIRQLNREDLCYCEYHEHTDFGNGFFTLFHLILMSDILGSDIKGSETIKDNYPDFYDRYNKEFYHIVKEALDEYARYHYDYPRFPQFSGIIKAMLVGKNLKIKKKRHT